MRITDQNACGPTHGALDMAITATNLIGYLVCDWNSNSWVYNMLFYHAMRFMLLYYNAYLGSYMLRDVPHRSYEEESVLSIIIVLAPLKFILENNEQAWNRVLALHPLTLDKGNPNKRCVEKNKIKTNQTNLLQKEK